MAASLSYNYKFLFIPVPRTSSTSIWNTLSPFVDEAPLEDIYHPTLKSLQEHFLKRGLVWEDYFSFCFVRNPWDRIISFFYRFKADNTTEDGSLRYDSPADWIITPHKLPPGQLSFMEDDHREIPLSFIGRFETLEKDFKLICSEIGMPYKKLSHLNKSKHNHYQEYYNEKTIEIIRQKYQKEIELLGYRYES